MARSPEYPDLLWMPPKSWTNANRKSVQVIVIHDTEGTEGINSAENGASYDQRRGDGTSTHYFHDQNSTVQCVRTEDIAHTARRNGNRIGIQHELCGRASQTTAKWADVASRGTLVQAAKQTARDCQKWKIPVRKISSSQVAAGVKGICGHVDITKAFPQDGGTHTDPGPNFPWDTFINLVEMEMATLDKEDADVIIDRMTARMRNEADAFSGAMRAVAWQYTGRGMQGADSTLYALADTQSIKAMLNGVIKVLADLPDIDPDELANKLIEGLVVPLKSALLDAFHQAFEEALPEDASAVRQAVEQAVDEAVEEAARRYDFSSEIPSDDDEEEEADPGPVSLR